MTWRRAHPGGRIEQANRELIQSAPMADEFDPTAMVERFRTRAAAVRQRGIPPIEGPERKRFVEQARLDYMDYAILGDADARIEDGVLVLRIDLRPEAGSGEGGPDPAPSSP